MDWAKILGDKAAYPDDAKFTINGQEVTLGAIRTQNAQSQGELERKLTERQTQQDQRERAQQSATDNLARIVENVQKATGLSVEQIVQGQIPANMRTVVQQATLDTRTAGGMALKDDPLYAPIVAELEPMRARTEMVASALGQSLNVYKNDRARLDFMEWDRVDKPAGADVKITFDEAVNSAVTKGYKNNEGWPDVKRAAAELAGPAVAKKTNDEIRQQGIEEGRRLAAAEMAARQGQPTFGMGDLPTTTAGVDFSGKPAPAGSQVKTIREQLDTAFSDPKMFQTNAVQ